MKTKETISYINDYQKTAECYASVGIEGTIYLGYRDVPYLINEFKPSNDIMKWNVLDYGCGAGKSTRFLKNIGFNFEVDGVDINEVMLEQARKQDPEGNYSLINSGEIPVEKSFYDIVFSSFVLFEIPSKHDMKIMMKEVARVLKPQGIFISVTGTTDLYDNKNKWFSLGNDFLENKSPKTGDIVKIYIKEADIIINDIYWTETDYEEAFEASGFQVIEKLKSIGKDEDNIVWTSEAETAPFVTYVARIK